MLLSTFDKEKIMLRWRLLLGCSIVVMILGLCVLDFMLERQIQIPGIALFPLLILLIVCGVREMIHLANCNRVFPAPFVLYFGCILIAASAWGMFGVQHFVNKIQDSVPKAESSGPEISSADPSSSELRTRNSELLLRLEHLTPGNWALSAFALAVIIAFFREMYVFARPGAVNVRLSYTVFTIVYVGLLPTFLAQIRLCHGLAMLGTYVAIIKMGDIGAYTVGRLFGRNKMAPSLSPGKTIEGAVGAILFSAATAIACFYWLMPLVGRPCSPDKLWIWIVYGVALGFLGMIGDLAESLLKRDAEIKDAGSLVPGFGGVLDILDSLLLAAPVAYAFLSLEILF